MIPQSQLPGKVSGAAATRTATVYYGSHSTPTTLGSQRTQYASVNYKNLERKEIQPLSQASPKPKDILSEDDFTVLENNSRSQPLISTQSQNYSRPLPTPKQTSKLNIQPQPQPQQPQPQPQPQPSQLEATLLSQSQPQTQTTNPDASPNGLMERVSVRKPVRVPYSPLPQLNSSTPGPSPIPTYQDEYSLPKEKLVDPDIITNEDRFEQFYPLLAVTFDAKFSNKRDKLVQELYATERTYIRMLQKVKIVYETPLKKEYSSNPSANVSKLMTTFTRLDNLLKYALVFYTDIVERLEKWDETTKIGDVIFKFSPFLKAYSEYTESYNEMVTIIKEEKTRDSVFNSILENGMKHNIAKGLDFGAFLICPVQRIPRYVMLLSDLLKCTPEDHCDYQDLQKALKKIKEVADHIDAAIATAENREKLLEIQNLFSTPLSILPDRSLKAKVFVPGRKFLFEGNLIKQCRKERKERRFFLFTDILWYAYESVPGTNSYVLSKEIDLLYLSVRDVEDNGIPQDKNCIEFLSSGKSFNAYASDKDLKMKWIQQINNAIEKIKQNQNTLRSDVKEKFEIAPVWQPDELALRCPTCKTEFNLLWRKHHCRTCGLIYCDSCAPRINNNSSDRICKVCKNKNK